MAERLQQLRSRQAAEEEEEQQQEQQQEQEPSSVPPNALLQRALALASRSLQQSAWQECAEHAAAAARVDPASKEARQLGILAAVMLHQTAASNATTRSSSGQAPDPWTLLSLAASHPPSAPAPPSAQPRTAALAQRLYRRLAAAVHPDKCVDPAWAPAAHAAFKLIAAARDAVQQGGSGTGGGTGGAGGWGGQQEGEEDGVVDGDAAWWYAWDDDARCGRCSDGGAGDGADEHTGAARRRCAPDAEFPNTEPRRQDIEAEAAELWGMEVGALKEEVSRRQAEVLAPTTEASKALGPVQRQRRLRVARDVLSARLARAEGAGEGEEEGWWCGFVPDAAEWMRHGGGVGAGSVSDDDPHKRQRVGDE